MLNKVNIITEIAEAAKRSAWLHIMSSPDEDADSIAKDPALLRLIWSEKDAIIIERWKSEEGDPETSDNYHAALDRGMLPFSEFIDIFFKAKSEALKRLQHYHD